MSKEQINNTLKASVFEDLFSDPQRRFELYKVLHPEDVDIAIDDVQKITLTQIFLKGQYNDLGLIVRNKLIVLAEAQSTWTVNIIPRCVMYLGETWLRYGAKHEFDWYDEEKVELPDTEMYVVYTGDKKIDKKEISLSEEFYDGRKTAIEAVVKVLTYSGGNDILDQYITFCKIFNEQRAMYPDDKPFAVRETIRICIERNVLKEYLLDRREEVATIMLTILDQEAATKAMIANERKKAAKEAEVEQAKRTAKEMYDDGIGIDKIVKYVKYPVATIEKWLGLVTI